MEALTLHESLFYLWKVHLHSCRYGDTLTSLNIRTFRKEVNHLCNLRDVIVAPGGDADASWDVFGFNECLIWVLGGPQLGVIGSLT